MATTTGSKATADSTGDATVASDMVQVDPPVFARPIVYEARKRRGKKRYSRRYKDPQKLEVGFSRSVERVAQAVADGVSRYRSRRNRSARRKKDGALKDLLRNVGRGAEKALRTGAKAPTDLTRRLTAKRLRRVTRMVPAPPFFFVRL